MRFPFNKTAPRVLSLESPQSAVQTGDPEAIIRRAIDIHDDEISDIELLQLLEHRGVDSWLETRLEDVVAAEVVVRGAMRL